jgi:hypothetical protein
MLIGKATKDSEAGKMPCEESFAAMGRFNEQLLQAGVLLEVTGLQPSSKGARVHFSGDGKIKVIDGPFAETKELIAGFVVIQAKSLQEAIEWAKRAPNLQTGQESHIEIRQLFELDDFAEGKAVDDARDRRRRLEEQKKK